MGANGCFLCDPDPDLVYSRSKVGVAMSGLGPLVEGYSVVATLSHERSAADAAAGEASGFSEFTLDIRQLLTDRYGSCLVTEHGRVPVCDRLSKPTEPHCYHAHFLMFPGAPAIEDAVRAYFVSAFEASTLQEALAIAEAHDEYFLLSPDGSQYTVLVNTTHVFRQFSRWLVADALGQPALADWQRFPMREKAITAAAALRGLVGGRC